jgi:hypothetical protein
VRCGEEDDVEPNADRDIVELLHQEHRVLRDLVARVGRGGPEARRTAVAQLSDALIRHEVAEELVVYPELLRIRGGAAVADSRLEDEEGIEDRLVQLDRTEFGTPEYEVRLARLTRATAGHLDREEEGVLPLLDARLGAKRRAELGQRFAEVLAMAPIRPTGPGLRMPSGPTVVDRTTATSVWLRDSAVASGLAS